MLCGRTTTCQAHFRSHSSRNAGAALSHAPTAPEFDIPPHLFRAGPIERVMARVCRERQGPGQVLYMHSLVARTFFCT